jgi:DnaJ domain
MGFDDWTLARYGFRFGDLGNTPGRSVSVNTVSFAATPKKKTCVKGVSCGNTCISARRVCRKAMSVEQQQAKKEIVSIVHIPKTESKSESNSSSGSSGSKKSINDLIDEKYASANPTSEDADNWFKERIDARYKPTPENVEQRTAEELRRSVSGREAGRVGLSDDPDRFSRRVNDAESYAKAMYAYEEWDKQQDPEGAKRKTDPNLWFKSLTAWDGRLSDKDLPVVQAKAAKGVKSAIKQLQKHNAAVATDDENWARAEELARTHRNRQAMSESERLQELRQEFKQKSAEMKSKMEDEYKPIAAGNKVAVKNARNDVATGLGIRVTSYDKRGTFRDATNDDVRGYLIQVAEKRDSQVFRGTSKNDVRKEYRQLAAKYHPDNRDTGDAAKFRQLTDAYNLKLRDFD